VFKNKIGNASTLSQMETQITPGGPFEMQQGKNSPCKSTVRPAIPMQIKECNLYLIQVTEMNLLHLNSIV